VPVSSSAEVQSTETLETSLTVPTTDITTSTVIEEATTTTADGLTTTEAATTDVASYQTTETTITESATTTTVAYAAPTAFKLRAQDGDAEGYALKSEGNVGGSLGFGPLPATYEEVTFNFDEETGHIQYGTNTLCVYYDDYRLAAEVRTCTSIVSGRYGYLTCEKPTSSELKCRMPGKTCWNPPSSPLPTCTPTGDEWAQFFVRPYMSGTFLFYFGKGDAADVGGLTLQPVTVQLSEEL
jgi:hypothetical protein